MSPWERLLEKPQARGHFLQLYRPSEEAPLIRNVGLYLSQGLERGEGGVVIATEAHCKAFQSELDATGTDSTTAVREKRLLFLDAEETLAQFTHSGNLDWDAFERTITSALGRVECTGRPPRVRAYGEMVGLLWNAGQRATAARLEQFWNRLLTRCSFALFCAYEIDVLSPEFRARALDSILCTHTHFLPSGSGRLGTALHRAMDSVLGAKAERIRALIRANQKSSWALMPEAERAILWLRQNLPEQSEDIVALTRAQLDLQTQ